MPPTPGLDNVQQCTALSGIAGLARECIFERTQIELTAERTSASPDNPAPYFDSYDSGWKSAGKYQYATHFSNWQYPSDGI
ncbi:MAG: hypothetical protein U5N86_07420 [Planctomycetota bacterium]|nr:hypothetical protein [Planctomycetota bacterium]